MATDLGPAFIGFAGVGVGSIFTGLFGWLTLRKQADEAKLQREHERQLADQQIAAYRPLITEAVAPRSATGDP